ncbi:MAG: methyltransferase family protein [Pseudomonadales bacterium]
MDKPTRKIYPPVWLLFGLLAMFALDHFFAPNIQFPPVFPYLGGAAILLGIGLAVWAGGGFKKADTDMVPFKNVTALVTDGIYRYTRNPMYLGMALVLLGTALLLSSLLAMLVIPVFLGVIQARFILPEEQMLRELFGSDYEEYCRRVRRWL